MPKIYKVEISKDGSGEFIMSPVYSTEFTEELYNKFRWDKVNVSYFKDVKKVTLMSDKIEMLSLFNIGAEEMLFIYKNWDNIFKERG